MREINYVKSFEKNIKYKTLGLIVQLLCLPCFLLIDIDKQWGNWYIYLMIALIFGTGLWLQSKYKCPHCQTAIETRIKTSQLACCPICGTSLLTHSSASDEKK